MLAADAHGASDAFALGADDLGEVHAAGVLNEDVEGGLPRIGGKCEMRLAEAAVERADEFLVDIDLRVIVEAIDGEFAAVAPFAICVR